MEKISRTGKRHRGAELFGKSEIRLVFLSVLDPVQKSQREIAIFSTYGLDMPSTMEALGFPR